MKFEIRKHNGQLVFFSETLKECYEYLTGKDYKLTLPYFTVRSMTSGEEIDADEFIKAYTGQLDIGKVYTKAGLQ